MNDLDLPLDATTGRLRARVLARNEWFASLHADLKQELLRRSVARRCRARSLVYAAGSAPGGFFVVLRGEVRLEHLARSGKFAFYQSMRAGDLFGLLSEVDGSPRFSDARAWSDALLMHLPHRECQDLYRRHPLARDAFVAMVCRQMHTTLNMLVEQHSIPPRRQVANILVTLLGDSGVAEGAEPPRLTHGAIAAMAGVSRPTVAKVLHEFRSRGLIGLQYGKIELLDAATLTAFAGADPAR